MIPKTMTEFRKLSDAEKRRVIMDIKIAKVRADRARLDILEKNIKAIAKKVGVKLT